MKTRFNESEFLTSVKGVMTYLPNVVNDQTAKNHIRSAIVNVDMDKDDVFSYIINLLTTNRPELLDRQFDVIGWKKIFGYFINNTDFPKFGTSLKESMDSLITPYQYKECFIEWATVYGHNPEALLNEIKLDCIGWWRIYATLNKIADEMGIVVEKPVAEEPKGKGGRKKKEETAKDEKKEDKKKTPSTSKRGSGKKTESVPEITPTEEIKDGEMTTEPETPSTSEVFPVEEVAETEKVEEIKGVIKPVKKGKRGYNMPILQYKRGDKFPDVKTASEMTGISVDEILSSMENKPASQVDCIWKYTNKQKKEIVQFVYFHTYKNLCDIDHSSKSICGKEINHSNVSPKLKKEWSSISKEEFVWIQISGEISTVSPEPSMEVKEVSLPEMTSIDTSEVIPESCVTTDPICEDDYISSNLPDNLEFEGYYMIGDEFDLESGPFGTYSSLQDIMDDLGIYELTLNTYFSPDSECNKLYVYMGGEFQWIGFKTKEKSLSMESAA